MPNFVGLSHLSLSVSDRDASVRWYRDVLDFHVVVADMDTEEWKRSICMHASGVMLSLTQHIISTPFDHRNAGIDHISFAVSKRSELDEWEQWLSERRVKRSPISETDLGSALSFRDPDDIPLEFYCLPS